MSHTLLRRWRLLFDRTPSRNQHSVRARRRSRGLLKCELLEERLMLTVFTVVNVDDSGAGSLRQAILNANSNPGTDTIAFDIQGGGVQTIRPTTPLPAATGPVLVDGYTQPGSSR